MCKGVNSKESYIISVDLIPEANKEIYFSMIPNIIKRHRGIPVDKCIGKEIENLIDKGVITKGCCCGHGKNEAECLISEESIKLVKKLGYKPSLYRKEDDTWEIRLHS